MHSTAMRLAVMAAAVLLIVCEAERAQAQGEYLRYRESGPGIGLSCAISNPNTAVGAGFGYSVWGLFDFGVEVDYFSRSHSASYTALVVGATVHPLKQFIESPLQPFASIAYSMPYTKPGRGSEETDEALGVHARIDVSKEFFIVPSVAIAWSDPDVGSRKPWHGAGVGMGIRTSSRVLLTLNGAYMTRDGSPGITGFGIGLVSATSQP